MSVSGRPSQPGCRQSSTPTVRPRHRSPISPPGGSYQGRSFNWKPSPGSSRSNRWGESALPATSTRAAWVTNTAAVAPPQSAPAPPAPPRVRSPPQLNQATFSARASSTASNPRSPSRSANRA